MLNAKRRKFKIESKSLEFSEITDFVPKFEFSRPKNWPKINCENFVGKKNIRPKRLNVTAKGLMEAEQIFFIYLVHLKVIFRIFSNFSVLFLWLIIFLLKDIISLKIWKKDFIEIFFSVVSHITDSKFQAKLSQSAQFKTVDSSRSRNKEISPSWIFKNWKF